MPGKFPFQGNQSCDLHLKLLQPSSALMSALWLFHTLERVRTGSWRWSANSLSLSFRQLSASPPAGGTAAGQVFCGNSSLLIMHEREAANPCSILTENGASYGDALALMLRNHFRNIILGINSIIFVPHPRQIKLCLSGPLSERKGNETGVLWEVQHSSQITSNKCMSVMGVTCVEITKLCTSACTSYS